MLIEDEIKELREEIERLKKTNDILFKLILVRDGSLTISSTE